MIGTDEHQKKVEETGGAELGVQLQMVFSTADAANASKNLLKENEK